MSNTVRAEVALAGDVKAVLSQLNEQLAAKVSSSHAPELKCV
jgi:thiamine pyrophosphate-dependent acetolactate synthase large subunit-like protein